MKEFNINKKVNPKGLKKDEYDAIIIGAGIGGLTCGCYLAKAGMKVLIVEKNPKPGGYCVSFTRKGFVFDAGIHAIEGLGENGRLTKIFSDLSLEDKLTIIRDSPADIIISKDRRIRVENNTQDLIAEFQANFPSESGDIERFFNYILNASLKSIYFDLKDRVFAEVLDRFIHNNELKDLICVLLRNVGLPSKKLAAINAVLFFRSYILEGGYYPLNGMRGLTDALCNKYKEYGGTVLLSNEVKKIKVANNKVEGVIIESGDLLSSSNVISNCDVTLTYLNLIGEKHISSNLSNRLKKMIPTISTFIVFLGINKNLKTTLEKTRAFWFLDKPDTENNFIDLIDGKTKWDDSCIMISSPSLGDPQLAPAGKESIFIVCNASFQNSEFWTTYRDELFSCIVKKAENVIPGLSSCIETMEMATPQTFYKYTFNREGGIHGWASLTTQIEGSIISERSVIKGLFLAGHWITQAGQGGLPTAVQSGANVAKMILTDK